VTQTRPGLFSRVRSATGLQWRRAKERHPALAHVVSSWNRLQANNGSQYAAAITYFSFLALFPLILLAVAIAGFFLNSHPAALHSLFAHIEAQVPGSFGTTLKTAIQTAIDKRTGVGIIGLLGVLLTGLGWIGNLRAAINAVWGLTPAKQNFLKSKLASLIVLVGLGLGVLVSLGLTVVGTSLTDQVLSGLHLDHIAGLHWVVKAAGLAVAVLGDLVIFLWLLVRLPRSNPPRRVALKGALMASIGLEVLKVVGSFTIAKSAHSPTAGPFASIIAILIWIQLVARFVLFCVAWMAVLTDEERAAQAAAVTVDAAPDRGPDAGLAPPEDRVAVSPALVAGSLLGVGAAAGAVATRWATRRTERS
jgi:membrane protein